MTLIDDTCWGSIYNNTAGMRLLLRGSRYKKTQKTHHGLLFGSGWTLLSSSTIGSGTYTSRKMTSDSSKVREGWTSRFVLSSQSSSSMDTCPGSIGYYILYKYLVLRLSDDDLLIFKTHSNSQPPSEQFTPGNFTTWTVVLQLLWCQCDDPVLILSQVYAHSNFRVSYVDHSTIGGRRALEGLYKLWKLISCPK